MPSFSHQVPFPHLEKRHAVGVLQLEKVRRTHARRVSQWVQLSFTQTHVQHCCSITSWLLFLFLSRFIGAPDAPTITYKHNSIRHVHYSLLYEYVLIIRPDFSFSCGKNHFGLVACFVFLFFWIVSICCSRLWRPTSTQKMADVSSLKSQHKLNTRGTPLRPEWLVKSVRPSASKPMFLFFIFIS